MDDLIKQQPSPTAPLKEGISTEDLESMSPVELANALELLLDPMTEEGYDPALIGAYLDALDQKAPMPERPSAEDAWQEFQKMLKPASAPANNKGIPVSPVRRRRYKRLLIAVAAAVALISVLMLGVQAAGLDVFGSLARWTDEIFHFVPTSG